VFLQIGLYTRRPPRKCGRLDTRRVGSVAAVAILALGILAVIFVEEGHSGGITSKGITLTGECTVNDWYEGDAVEIRLTTVTTTIGNTTTYYTTSSTISAPTPEITSNSTYTVHIPANTSTTYTITSTSIDQDAAPVGVWFVTTCTYTP